MASGFRRSLARRGGRTVAALVAIVVVGQAGLVPTATALTHLVAEAQAVRIGAGDREPPSIDAAERGPTVDLAAFDGAPVALDPVAAPDPGDPADPGDPGGSDAADSYAGLQPSIQYEEAERHATDRIAFTPGNRVTVGFQPRPGDHWSVGGLSPTTLPAGRLDGRTIRAQGASAVIKRPSRPDRGPATTVPATPVPADRAADSAVDLPSDTATPVAATSAAFQAPLGAGAATPTIQPDAVVKPDGLRREIFGFLPYWEVNSSSLRLDYSKISTVAYFGVGADGAGNLQKRNSDGSITVGWSGWTSSSMTSVISAAHASHTRVVLTVQSFGWSTSGLTRQKSLLGSSTHRLNLARQIAAAVRDRGADGVNLDFEPLASTYDNEFTALVRTIRAELNKVHSGYQITFDTLGSIGNYPIADATAPGGADAIFIMGYDYRSASSNPVGSIAPLTRTGYDIRDTILAYTARVAPSKLILGVPYYGRAWSTATGALRATNTSGTKYGASTAVVYDTAADVLAQHGRHYDATEGVAWTAYQRENCTSTYGCVTSWRELYVDDATAIGAKYDLVNTYRLRGAGIWALGYDGTRPELWAAIQRKFVTDTTPPIAGVRTLPARQVNPGFTVTWTGRDDVAVASYDVQVSVDGGAWVTWLAATKATSAAWSGFDTHAYAFRVRARDPKGNLGTWNVTSTSPSAGAGLAAGGFGIVRVDALSIRSAPGTAATVIGQYASGDVVAIVAGPRSVDGYTWFQVVGPLTEWGAVAARDPAAWIPTSGGRMSPAKAPNTTRVGAAIGGLGFGNAGPASIGSAAAAVAHRAFSPNGNHSGDTLALDWTNDRAFDSLSLRVFKADGTLLGSVPVNQLAAGARQAAWDGKVGGSTLPNGRYLVSLVGTAGGRAFYNPVTSFRSAALAAYGVTIDTVAPTITSSSVSSALISPNGDGILDTIRVTLGATGADGWTFSASPLAGSTAGAPVTTRSGTGGSAAVAWNGRTNGGAVVPDGTYRLTLSATDHAGNRTPRAWTVRVDHTPAAIQATATPATFSPNGDGAADTTRLGWTASERISGLARVVHGTTVIRSWTVSGAMAGSIAWNGRTAAGTVVADGTYTFRVTGRDAAGNLAVRTVPITVDRTLSSVRWSRSAFFPQDGDALTPTAAFSFSLKRGAVVTVGIYSGSTLVRMVCTGRSFAAGAHSWTWDGKDSHGAFVARGTYSVRVTARSWVGTSVVSRSILVDAFRIALSATSVSAGQTLIVTVTTTEGLRSAPVIAFSRPGRAVVTRTATALGSGQYRATFVVAAGTAGKATIRVTGRDSGGGLNTSTRSVTIR
ncbi:MAG TPA: glycosyl hydrolase family 18 protein [Candidatus Limnocylindrales bacterium]|nr:glycosyl hydrolase family 18 protein [Candidatus Limnocylindrales bacterium]